MNLFKNSAMIINMRRDIIRRENLLKKQQEAAAKKDQGPLSQLFSQTSKGDLDLFEQRPKKKIKMNNQAEKLKGAMNK